MDRGGRAPSEATLPAGVSPGTPRSPSQRRRILIIAMNVADIGNIEDIVFATSDDLE